MNNRLKAIIQYRTTGKQSEFAELMGWSSQYLYKLLKDGNVGIRPIIAILQNIPEINARWLLLGEGAMINNEVDHVKEHLLKLIALDKYICVMSPDELRELHNGRDEWEEETISKWQTLLDERNRAIEDRYQQAYKRATENQNNANE